MTNTRAATTVSQRDAVVEHAPKPALRGWLHLVCFEVSLIFVTILVTSVPPDERTVALIYAVVLSGLFGTSALYHRGSWTPPVRRLLQRADHAMIFLLIAGTATPVFAVAVDGTLAVAMLVTLWGVTALALLTHLIWMSAPEWLVGGTYIALGCSGAAALPAVWRGAGETAFALLLIGGVLYIAGALLYHAKRPDPWPAVFGYHEVFHVFVCAAAASQYTAIAYFIL